jgi:type I restriction enzyme S subunit
VSVAILPLGDLCGILSGFAWSASKFNQDKRGVPIIRIQNVDAVLSNDFVYWDEPYDERFVIRQGDLLLTLSGSFRIESWSGPDALLNQRIIKLTPSPNLDKGWLLHVLRPRLGQIERLGKHALVNNVSLGDIRNLAIPLPPIAEQKRIAEILDRAEALRAKRRVALAQLDSLNQSLFLDLFGDHDVCDAEAMPLGQAVETVTVGHVGPTAEFFCADGIPFLRTGNVGTLEIIQSDLKRITPEFHRRLKKSTLKKGDVLVSRVISDEVRCTVVPPEFDGANCANVIVIRPGERLLGAYLAQLIYQPRSQTSFLQRRVGSAQSVVNTRVLQNWQIEVPPIQLQREFARRVSAVEELKIAQRASLAELDALFASLGHRAFRGEL